MQNPGLSFFSAFVIWLAVIAAFSFVVLGKSAVQPQAIEIDAISFGEVVEEKTPARNRMIEKPATDKSSDLKKAEEEVKQHDHHLSESEKKLLPIYNPLPKIPDELRDEAFNSEAVARFHIGLDGAVIKVELIKPCANPKLNHLLLTSLKSWKFAPSKTTSTQDIRVNFVVR